MLFADFEGYILKSAPVRRFILNEKTRDIGIFIDDGNPIIAQGDYTISIGGGQPGTGTRSFTEKLHVASQVALPE